MKAQINKPEPSQIEIVNEGEIQAYSQDGVDLSLVRSMLSLTPTERLRYLHNHINMLNRFRSAKTND